MYKRILVPTDGSDITGKAVQTAIELAALAKAELYTIGVKAVSYTHLTLPTKRIV